MGTTGIIIDFLSTTWEILVLLLGLIATIRFFMMLARIVANTQHTSESTQQILSEIREYIGSQNRTNTPPSPTGTFEEWQRRQAEGGGAENNERN
jgi:hypothetical protein